jgi:hypothetical protein
LLNELITPLEIRINYIIMVDSKYGGLSRREIEMRKKMAQRFGHQTAHLEQPEQVTMDFEQIYREAIQKTPKVVKQSTYCDVAVDVKQNSIPDSGLTSDNSCGSFASDTGTSTY